jgi:hypothetical protein
MLQQHGEEEARLRRWRPLLRRRALGSIRLGGRARYGSGPPCADRCSGSRTPRTRCSGGTRGRARYGGGPRSSTSSEAGSLHLAGWSPGMAHRRRLHGPIGPGRRRRRYSGL